MNTSVAQYEHLFIYLFIFAALKAAHMHSSYAVCNESYGLGGSSTIYGSNILKKGNGDREIKQLYLY